MTPHASVVSGIPRNARWARVMGVRTCLGRMSTSGSKGLWVAQTLKDKAPFCKAIIISEQDPAILSRLEAESGFVCLAKTRLASELALTLRRVTNGPCG